MWPPKFLGLVADRRQPVVNVCMHVNINMYICII